MEKVKGYKVFDPDFTCRDFQYEVGKTYKHKGSIGLCEAGFHFCSQLKDCFNYYSFNPDNKVAEIVASGEVIVGDGKSVTNTIKIVREISWSEVLELVNTGKANTGLCNTGNCNTGNCNTGDRNTGDRNTGNCNTGNWNTGDWNTGDWNTGDRNTGNCNTGNCNTGNWNTGDWNTGDRNTGDRNTGDRNTGNCNTGNCNTGNWNTGDWNTGDWNTGDRNTGLFNSCNYSNGLFNSKSPKIYMFNKPTKLTYEELQEKHPEAYNLLYYSSFKLTEWIPDYNMSDEEKTAHPEYKTIGGYLKRNGFKEVCQKMWDSFSKTERNKIKKLPNFDRDIFKKITGIEV